MTPRPPRDSRPNSRSTHVGVGAPLHAAQTVEPDASHLPLDTGPPSRLAVIVAHGMGQQMHFETLESVAEILRGAEARTRAKAPPVTVRMVRLAGKEFPRAEVRVTGADGRPRDVHLYECYWAPITEGKVTTAESVWFLIASGLRGMRHAIFTRGFERYMFDRPIRFPIPFYAFLQFFAAVLVIGALLAINALMFAVLTSRTVAGGAGSWVSDAMLADLTADLGVGLIGIFGGGVIATLLPRLLRGPVEDSAAKDRAGFTAAVVSAVAWLFMIVALASIVMTAALMLWHGWLHVRGAEHRIVDVPIVNAVFDGFGAGPWTAPQWIALLVIWTGGLVVNLVVRRFLLQYVGDVAAYISAHTVSKFQEVRDRIQACALEVADAVYREPDPAAGSGSPGFAYPEVVVVGHSLGSVVAYDTLNALLVKDALDQPPLGIAARTRTLVTFGSPLDKTAFIFRAQRRRATGTREALAAAKQPMILAYDRRPERWVNIHSPNDWISGSPRVLR